MLVAAQGFFTQNGLAFGWRWLHVLFGITWIGLLYYFNLVQVPVLRGVRHRGDGAKARNIAIDKLARRRCGGSAGPRWPPW